MLRRGSLGSLPLHREQDRRAEVTLHHSGGCDADDAGVPALPAEDERGGLLLRRRQGASGALRALHHLLLGPAALRVGAVELLGDHARAIRVVGQHELDAGVGSIEPAGGVDPGCQPEPQRARVDGLGVDRGRCHQGTKARRAGCPGEHGVPRAPGAGSPRQGEPCPPRSPGPPGRGPRPWDDGARTRSRPPRGRPRHRARSRACTRPRRRRAPRRDSPRRPGGRSGSRAASRPEGGGR